MQASDLPRAVAAATSIASALGLAADDAVVLHDSNRLTVRLRPCDILARVAPVGRQVANFEFEVELAKRLSEAKCPVAVIDPRVEPLLHERDGFVVTLWTYYESQPAAISPADYAAALEQLHAGMRNVDTATPHFTDRVAEAHAIVESPDISPALADEDRELLREALRAHARAIGDRGADEQLLHGEPHPGNLLSTRHGPLFVDLETCCRGPIEFDLAHLPEGVHEHYRDADQELIGECRALALAMVAAWRWDRDDDLPNRARAARALVDALRQGPPWPALDTVMGAP